MRLKIGDDFLDMDSSIIAQTYAVNEIGNLKTRQGGFSNDFTIPLTARNQGILGVPGDINSASRNPYTKVAATLFDNGAPVAFGPLKFQIFNDTTLQASFFADNSEWYSAIKDKLLSDLDLSEFDHVWNAANIDDSSLTTPNTSGFIYPLIDYGEFATEATLTATVTQLYPAMFVHSVITRILFEAGWKIEGELVDHPVYNKMIMPFANADLVHSDSFLDDNFQLLLKNADQLMSLGGDFFVEWDTASDLVVTPAGGVYDFNFTVVVDTIGATVPVIDFYRDSILIINLGTLPADGTFSFLVPNITMAAGGDIQVKIDDSPTDTTVCRAAGTFIEVTLHGEIIENSTIEMSRIVPTKMKQSDLIRYIFFIFGVVAQANTNSRTIKANLFNSIKANLDNAVDWSDKLDISKTKEVNFTQLLDKYKSVSVLDYKDDDNDNELKAYEVETGETFGQGQFDIDNDHIQGLDIIFEAPFSPMININSFNNEMYIPQIRWLDSAGVKEVNPEPKIALIETGLDVDLLSRQVASTFSYGGNVASTIPFCWFVKTDYTTETNLFNDSLAFDQVAFPNANGEPMKDRFLKDYEDILNSMKYLKAFFHLTEVDISELDFTLPVFIEFYKAYFYISKIPNFVGSKGTTEAELTKIA